MHEPSSADYRRIKKTPLNSMTLASGSGLIAQYEELRGQAVAHPAGVRSLEYTLFTRQGMAAWARVCRNYTIEPPGTPASPPATAPHPVPLELRTQVAVVLAGIIFHLQRQEVRSC
jgi:hypothetical protein